MQAFLFLFFVCMCQKGAWTKKYKPRNKPKKLYIVTVRICPSGLDIHIQCICWITWIFPLLIHYYILLHSHHHYHHHWFTPTWNAIGLQTYRKWTITGIFEKFTLTAFNLVSKININVQVPNERCMSPEKMTENLHVYLHGIHRSCTPTLTYAVPREIQHQNTPFITVIL